MRFELKPCPFCGKKPIVTGGKRKKEKLWEIRCDCNAECTVIATVIGTSELEVTNAWNHRHYPPEVQQAIDKQKPELAIITKELGYNPDGDIYDVGCPDCGKVLRYVNFVRGATTDCIRHCMDCGKKMNVRIDAEVEDE